MTAKPRSWSWKPLAAWVVSFGILFGGLGYWVVGTPSYSLYCLARSIEQHDLPTFRRYVDTRAVVENAVDSLMDDANELVWGKQPADGWQAIGRSLSGAVLGLLRPRLHDLAETAVNRQLAHEFLKLDQPGIVPPAAFLLDIEREGRVARAEVRLEGSPQPVRLVMEQGDDRRWRVVVIDKAFLKELIFQVRGAQPTSGI